MANIEKGIEMELSSMNLDAHKIEMKMRQLRSDLAKPNLCSSEIISASREFENLSIKLKTLLDCINRVQAVVEFSKSK